MTTARGLQTLLERLEGRGYPRYKEIAGRWDMGRFRLDVDHVQGDPFASPSRVTAHLPPEATALDPWLLRAPARRFGVAAWLARAFSEGVRHLRGRGSGKSGVVRMASPGQLVVPQSAVRVHPDGSVEARFRVGLPAQGRRILGREAVRLLTETVPERIEALLLGGAHPPEHLRVAAAVNEDADALRAALERAGLVAFVAEGSRLPRVSGVDDRPLAEGAVPFEVPESLRVELEAPNAGTVAGLGIPRGVTLVVGGGFHGKSTLLRALEAGVYNHRPGDGRERVVTDPSAVKIRAEDGRSVRSVDISPFIDGLPGGRPTTAFTTDDASGSTSQAAALVEAVELGTRLLLMDEDTCATNFLIRDRRMQALVPSELEPITPLVDRIGRLHRERGVSAVLALGGSGDYLDVADTVLGMDAFRVRDLTARAREVASAHPTGRRPERTRPLSVPSPRPLGRGSLPPGRRDRPLKVRVGDGRTVRVGDSTLDLGALEQLLIPAQLQAVAVVLEGMSRNDAWVGSVLAEWAAATAARMATDLDALDARKTGEVALVRPFELGAALNRLRSLVIESQRVS